MRSRNVTIWAMVVMFVIVADVSATTVFSDDFENDTTGTFPAQWTISYEHPDQINADAIVVDEATDPGAIYEGNKSVRITFNGGSTSGIQTTFAPVTHGVVTFFCRVDWASDDLQLLGLFNYSDTFAPDSHLICVSAEPWNHVWEYSVGGMSIGIPVVFGEYARFDLHFDTELSVATLYINDEMTSIVNFPFENPSAGVTTLRSCDDSGPGTARRYLDNVTVIPEPATLLLLGLGAMMLRRKQRRSV